MSTTQDETAPTRQILLVDDNMVFSAMMKEFLLLPGHGDWIVHTAENYSAALACLKNNAVDLIVLDVNLPIMDGLQFLTLLKKMHPAIPVVMLTNMATEENRSYCLQHGAALFLDKAAVAESFDSIYAALESVAGARPTEGFRGMLPQVGLPEVLQMECLGRKSSLLEIKGHEGFGRIYISDGSIIHAEYDSTTGEPALFQILGLAGGEFQLKPFSQPPRQTIDGHWESLLMESARLRDERDALADRSGRAGPGFETEFARKPAEIPIPLNREVTEIVLCSDSGEILYEWNAENIERRARLLDQISAKAAMISKTLPVGRPDRLEVETYGERVVMLLQSDRKVFVRTAVTWPESEPNHSVNIAAPQQTGQP